MDKAFIRVLDESLNLLAEIDDYESLIFIRRFFKVGEFELHINLDKEGVDKLIEDNLIVVNNDEKKVGIIEYIEKTADEEGVEKLIVKGPTLEGITRRRITIPMEGAYDRAEGTQEAIIKRFVENNIVNPTDSNRKIPQVVIAPNQNRGEQDRWRTRYEALDEKIAEIAQYSGLGWEMYIDFDSRKWVFDVVQGRDLTTEQNDYPPVIFSVDFENIKEKNYLKSLLKHKNVGYAGGKGEEENRLIQQIGEGQGLCRRETFINCSNAETVNELLIEGKQKLEELKELETFETRVIPDQPFIYGEDYNLGDIVTCIDRDWGIELHARITEIREIYEVENKMEVIFGNDIPSIIDDIKKANKEVVR